jgi:hypothetical protein
MKIEHWTNYIIVKSGGASMMSDGRHLHLYLETKYLIGLDNDIVAVWKIKLK